MWVREVLVPLDASAGDRDRLDAATSLALSSGAGVILLVPRTSAVLRRLDAYARAEGCSRADAGEQYAAHAAASLQAWGIDARGVSCPSTDPARDIAWFAYRHDVSLVLLLGPDRWGAWGSRRVGQRLLRLTSLPVLAVSSPDLVPAAGDRAA